MFALSWIKNILGRKKLREDDIPPPLIVDFNLFWNRYLHNTLEYEDERLIVRRGQEFKLSVVSKEEPFEDDEIFGLQFSVGKDPSQPKETLITIQTSAKIDRSKWSASAKIQNKTENDMTTSVALITVTTPPTAIVGEYTLTVIRNPGTDEKKICKQKDTVVVLFNAWCKDDAVYLENEDERQEYVTNDKGRVWVGSKYRSKPWGFGQFQKDCFDAALYLLEKSYVKTCDQGNAVKVTRALSAMVNSSDDNGVLVGNWSGDYEGGKSPLSWTGSPAILSQFMDKKKPVKFGQCWVFSALTTTVSRALGIPCRSVTNFDSAHDTDGSFTIDFYFDCDGCKCKWQPNDSVWNFHVWNEAWLKRNDLPEGNDGWQAFDATPQEASGDMYRCGPAPVAAIKRGDVFLPYDTGFVFGEVNGDRIHWEVHDDGDCCIKEVRKNAVGSAVMTKSVLTPWGNDITSIYKHNADSEEERTAVRNACRYSDKKDKVKKVYDYHPCDLGINFEGDCEMQDGGFVNYILKMKNGQNRKLTVNAKFSVFSQSFMGIIGDEIADPYKCTVELGAHKANSVNWCLRPEIYFNDIAEDSSVIVMITAKVEETCQTFTHEEAYQVQKPEIAITVTPEKLQVGKEYTVKLKFKNPIGLPLEKGNFMIEGPGIETAKTLSIWGIIGPNAEAQVEETFTPKRDGVKDIVATFNSRQLTNICGVKEVTVEVDPNAPKPPKPDPEADPIAS